MGDNHKYGDSIPQTSLADTNPGGPINIIEMWKDESASTRYRPAARSFSEVGSVGEKVEQKVDRFVDDLVKGKYSDSEVARRFTEFAKGFKADDALALNLALNGAFQDKNLGWHVRGGNKDISLYKNQPDYDDKELVETRFFKPGEDIDADFKPNKETVAKLARDFAGGNPDLLSPADLKTKVDQTIALMKAAGAGPSDVKHALNDAFSASGQALRITISTKGKVEIDQYHRNHPVAEVNY